ncbi:MAG: 50S ribosomal protein L21 [Bacteroidales bacterium]|nr:50S ribosomal protein L21 [Bacteroidales bacterium]
MYAIVDIAGQQFKVQQGKKIFVHRLQAEEGSSISLDKVLLTDFEQEVLVGAPYVDGAMVKATVLEHLKGEKVIVFKKKRRKGYQKKNGHRQCLTRVHIDEIVYTNKEN